MENPKPSTPKDKAAKAVSPAKVAPKTAAAPVVAASAPARVPPLFRKIDWLTMLIAFGVVWIVYFLTLAPQVTLEDSGELVTGSFYAGIPHPPGYPFWSLYSWLWTALLPVGNAAWRVEVGESFAAAMACGMVGLMVSRGSSMLVEGIEELKGLTGRWESAICMVSGAVAGISLGFGGVMWSESVAINRISLFGVPWVMLVLLLMLRWIYAPHQRRYLYFAMFAFGICTTIHQTLLCAGLGFEACIAMANPRLGRNFFHWNSFLLLGGVIVKMQHMTSALNVDDTLLLIFVVVLIGSILLYGYLAFITKETLAELWRDAALAATFLLAVYAKSQKNTGGGEFCWVLCVAAFSAFGYFAWITRKSGSEWLVVFCCGVLVALGAAFYLWEPITGMTNPPMEWGYPRTVDGFWHALSRGQYEQAHPTNLTTWEGWKMFYIQLGILISGIAEEYNWVLLFVALVPLLFIAKMKKRERTWILGLLSVYFFIGILLLVLMNPQEEKQSVDLHKVFFTSSHGLLAILMGYGMTLIASYMATHYQKFRNIGLMIGGLALLPALVAFYNGICNTFFWGGEGLAKFNYQISLFLVIATAFALMAVAARMYLRTADPAEAAPDEAKMFFMMSLGGAALFVLLSVYLAFFNERSLHPDQFFGALPRMFSLRLANLPAQAGGLIVAIAFVFILGLIAYRDRAPLALTLGLFALMPVASVMSHWATSEQRNHWFGYWYGHDMFSAPFTAPDGKLSYDPDLRAAALKGTNAALVYPEIEPGAIIYGGTDPGRFCPTYMIFCESFIPHKCQPEQDQKFDRRDVYIITQNALADDTYLDYLRAQYNRSQQIDPPFFRELLRSADEIKLNYKTNWRAQLAYEFLDKPLTRIGANVEARRRREGVYPPKEIYIPSPDDLAHSFVEYQADLQQRMAHDTDPRFNGEPRLLKSGEQPTLTPDGQHYSIAGQVSVMAINGVLTKYIFDRNPTNEFYVEESFPLDWMFPHLTPYGDIMKLNREPVAEFSPEIIRRDHEFWSRYSDRLIGNWITYDTTVKEITDFVDKVYVQHDLSSFTGNHAFMRDESAQKSFSKLRTAIAGLYAWRLGLLNQTPTPADFMPRNVDYQQRLIHEADFAYRQAFAYCPYSPEVVFRYVQFLAAFHRFEDARLVAETCHKLDPNNEGVTSLAHELENTQASAPPPPDNNKAMAAVTQLEQQVHDHPDDLKGAVTLAEAYFQLQQTTKGTQVLDAVMSHTNVDSAILSNIAGIYYATRNFQKLGDAFKKLAQAAPDVPENWYNLASLESAMGQAPDAIKDLRRALEENTKRLARDPRAPNLAVKLATDPNFAPITNQPEFQSLISAPK
jgi:tetratricopeptide (TPR) repeat protein